MKSRKYESYAAAVEAMKVAGILSYYGREQNYYLYGIELPDGREYGLNIHEDGLVTIRERGEPTVMPYKPPAHITKDQRADLYKDGICECMTMGRYRWKVIHGEKVYMCVKCNRPKYWSTAPPTK